MVQIDSRPGWWERRRETRRDAWERAWWSTVVGWQWADTVRGARLVHHSVTAGGMAHTSVPQVTGVDAGPPVTLLVRMLPGQVLGDFQGQGDRIAQGMGATLVRITQRGCGYLRIVLLAGDPLAERVTLPGRPVGTSAQVPVLLGADENGDTVAIDFSARVHLIVQGRTGSGKSRLSYGLLTQIAAAPDAIIAGSDPSSVLLRPFQGSRHAEWQVLGADAVRHAELLERLVREMERRLSAIPDRCDVLPLTADDPMMFIVLEEWLALLGIAGGDRKLRDRLTTCVRRLAAEAGKVGMRLIMLPQRAEANELGGGLLRGQFAYRVTLPVDNVEAIRLLHPTVAASVAEEHVEHGQPGVALYHAPGRDLGRLRTPWINDYADYWDTIKTLTATTATDVNPGPESRRMNDAQR